MYKHPKQWRLENDKNELRIRLNGEDREQTTEFTYLGGLIVMQMVNVQGI